MQPIAKQKCYCPCVMRKVVHSHEPIIHNSPCIQIMALVVVLELLNTITSPSPKPCCLRVAFSLELVEYCPSLSIGFRVSSAPLLVRVAVGWLGFSLFLCPLVSVGLYLPSLSAVMGLLQNGGS